MIETKNLVIGHGKGKKTQPIASIPNFSLKPGEVLTVLGKNGSGKSTLVKTLLGLLPPITGDVFLHEKQSQTIKQRAKVLAYVPTTMDTLEYFLVRDFLLSGKYPHLSWNEKMFFQRQEIPTAIIEEFHLEHLLERSLQTLSDGEKKRCLIARAILQASDFILLDEPTSHLDIGTKLEIEEHLIKLSEARKGLIMATHELNLALRISHFILIMGKTPELYENTPTTKQAILKKCAEDYPPRLRERLIEKLSAEC